MNKKIVTIQDISCYGQCSITVALPILSAIGFETAILPSAILSTHTSGFKNFTVHDLSDELPKILNHWKDEKLSFDALYAGYLGDRRHFDIVKQIKKELLKDTAIFFLDPVMGDDGQLYPAFNNDYVLWMRDLIKYADIIDPNLTEAALLTGSEYKEEYDEEYIRNILNKLVKLGAKTIILTGISYEKGMTGVVLYQDGKYTYYKHKKINKSYHGTGDVYSSTLLGLYLRCNDLLEAIKGACDFTVKCIENTLDDEKHVYGVKFEPLLKDILKEVR